MKNSFLIAISAITLFSLSSCGKDFTCSCTVNGVVILNGVLDTSKKEAENECAAIEENYKETDQEATCELIEN